MSNILIGVTGSIAAYKALDIISALVKQGHDVKVIMTESSKMFVTEMSLATISKNPVASSFLDEINGVVTHVELGKWADYFVIVPATYNTINKIKHGIADNSLTATYSVFAGNKPHTKVIIVPAMNTNMYKMMNCAATLATLAETGHNVIYPVNGVLACGDEGNGKLAPVSQIVDEITCKILEDEHNA